MQFFKIFQSVGKSKVWIFVFCLSGVLSAGEAQAAALAVDPCYSELEMAALFSKMKNPKPSLQQRLAETGSRIKGLEKKIKDKNKKIREAAGQLARSLDENNQTLLKQTLNNNDECSSAKLCEDDTYKAADALSAYIGESKNKWSCDKTAISEKHPTDAQKYTSGMYDDKCRDWQKGSSAKKYVGPDGDVNKSLFCQQFAADVDECEDALEDLEKHHERIHKWEEDIENLEETEEELEDQIEDIEDGLAEPETQDQGLCISCVKEIRKMNGPSPGETFGNVLLMGLGGALSVFGAKEARRSQRHANDMLALQGFPSENNFHHSLAGVSLGFPLFQQGLHGLTRPRHGCANSYSPYGHPHAGGHSMMHQQMQAYAQQQMQFQMMAGGFNPLLGGNMGGQFTLNPYSFNPAMSFNMGAGAAFNPMAQFNLNAGVNPFMSNPFMAMANPAMSFNMGAGAGFNPMAAQFNPMAQFNLNGGGNPFMAFNPMMQAPGMNSSFATYQSQMAMQQMQMRMQVQQAMFAQQMSAQQEWMRRQEKIGVLTQELYNIQAQIQMVASGGSGASLGGTSSIHTGSLLAGSTGPQHNPTPGGGSTGGGDDLPTISGR